MADFNRGQYFPPPPQPPRLPGIGIDEALLGSSSVHSRGVLSLSWNLNGKRLATASEDKTARVYEVDDNGTVKSIAKLEGHGDALSQVCWDPINPNRLATLSGDRDKSLKLWDVRTCQPTSIKLSADFLNMSWSSNGSLIAVGSVMFSNNDGLGEMKDIIAIVDLKSGDIKTLMFPYQIEEFCFSPNSEFLLITTEYGTVEVVKFQGEEQETVRSIQSVTGNCFCIAIDPTNTLMAVGSKDGLISIWSLDELICLRTIGDHLSQVKSICFSPDGSMIASCSHGHTSVQISDIEGKHLNSIETGSGILQISWQKQVGSNLIAVARVSKDKGDGYQRTDYVRLINALPK